MICTCTIHAVDFRKRALSTHIIFFTIGYVFVKEIEKYEKDHLVLFGGVPNCILMVFRRITPQFKFQPVCGYAMGEFKNKQWGIQHQTNAHTPL